MPLWSDEGSQVVGQEFCANRIITTVENLLKIVFKLHRLEKCMARIEDPLSALYEGIIYCIGNLDGNCMHYNLENINVKSFENQGAKET